MIRVKLFPHLRHYSSNPNTTFVYDVQTGYLIEAPDEVATILEIATENHSGIEEIIPDITELFCNRGFDTTVISNSISLSLNLVADGIIGRSSASNEHLDMNYNTLALLTSPHCQLNCNYCYANSGNFGITEYTESMTFDTAKKAVDFYFNLLGNKEEYNILFFGGEPLLDFCLIRKIVKYAESEAYLRNGQISFVISTNGLLVTDEVAEYFKAHNFTVRISIDGNESQHNTHRKALINGNDSFSLIKSAISSLKKAYGSVKGNAVITSNEFNFAKITSQLLAEGITEVAQTIVTSQPNTPWALTPDMLREYVLSYKKGITDLLSDKNTPSGYMDSLSAIIKMRIAERNGEEFCGIGDHGLAVDSYGRIYACHRTVGDERYKVGDLEKGIDEAKNREIKQNASAKNTLGCRSCWAIKICGGRCYAESMFSNGKPNIPDSYGCYQMINTIETILELYVKMIKENSNSSSNAQTIQL